MDKLKHSIIKRVAFIRNYLPPFQSFLGRNDLRHPVYDPTTGGCRDGLHSDRPNENQGAESTVAFLQSLLELRLAENIGQSNEHNHNEQSPIGNLSSLQTRLYPDSREPAVPSKSYIYSG